MNPWEKYQSGSVATEEAAPWTKYAGSAAVYTNLLKENANSLDYKMAIAGAKQAESLPQYAGRFVKEGALPALGATAGTAIGGIPGGMAGAALGETVSQATGLTPAGSVISEANKPDLGRVATQAIAQGAIPLAAAAGKRIYGAAKGLVEPFYQGGREAIIGRTLNTASGGQKDAVAQALMQARELVPGSAPTAGQAANNAGIASLERAASSIDPTVTVEFGKRAAEQNAARVNVLKNIAGDDDVLSALKLHRESVTAPMRQASLSQANIAGKELPALEKVVAEKQAAIADALARRAQTNLPVATPSQNALRSAVDLHGHTPAPVPLLSASQKAGLSHDEEVIQKSFAQIAAAQEAKAALPKPLEATDITRRISGVMAQPGLRANDLVAKTLGAMKEKIASIANKSGIVEANDLYMVRKQAGTFVKKFSDETKDFDQKLAAGLVKDIQSHIDDAIEAAGGKGWREYLAKYQAASAPINQMKVGQSIADKAISKTTGEIRPDSYANALTDQTAQAATHYKKAALADVMSPQQMEALNAVKADLSRAVMAQKSAGTAGSDTVKKLAYSNLIDRAGVPTFLREFAPTQIVGNILARGGDAAYSAANRDLSHQLAMTLLNPKEAARVMGKAMPSRYDAIIAELLKKGAPMTGATASQLANQRN